MARSVRTGHAQKTQDCRRYIKSLFSTLENQAFLPRQILPARNIGPQFLSAPDSRKLRDFPKRPILSTATKDTDQPMDFLLTPGAIVRHPNQPDWGLGRIQAVDGDRIAVNFEEAGRQIIRQRYVVLEIVEPAVGYE
jgi:hypothetical protein